MWNSSPSCKHCHPDTGGEGGVTFDSFREQGAVMEGLMTTLREGTFVHAYLISGMQGVGKKTLAGLIAQYLLCKAGNEDGGLLTGLSLPDIQKPCGVCSACRQVRAGTHPDVIRVGGGVHISPRPEDAKKAGIVVEDVRELVRIASTHTFEGGRRVIWLDQADTMNPQAQNALLKTLEEPIAGTVFLLLTEKPDLLLPTIISRCRHIKLHPWPDDAVLRALKRRDVPGERMQEALHVSGGSIGRALEIAVDEDYWQRRGEVMRDFFDLPGRSEIVRISASWKDRKAQAGELLDDVEDMLRTLMLVRLRRYGASAVAGYPDAWRKMAEKADLSAFIRLLDAVREARKLKESQVTWQAVVERLLLRLMEEKTRWST